MSRAPGTEHPKIRHLVSAVFALAALSGLAGCREDPAPPAPEAATGRAKEAEALYARAQRTAVPEKYELLRRVVGTYGDTPRGKETFLELTVLLLHDVPPRTVEALAVARQFRARHPKDPLVGESYRHVADMAYAVKDEGVRVAALDEWFKHLVERELAADLASPVLRMGFVNVLLRQEKWQEADVAIDTALGEAEISRADRIELWVRKGNLLAGKLGDKPGARTAFQKGLEIARQPASPSAGPAGTPPDQIEAELKKLGE